MFTLTLVTPEKRLVAGAKIEEVFVPAYRGELNILPGHAPLMTILTTGVLRYRLKGQSNHHYVAVSSGYVQVNPQGVNVLAEIADEPSDINLEEITRVQQAAENRINKEALEPHELEKLQIEIARAQARREVVVHAGSR